MIPRTEVDFLDGSMPAYRAFREVQEAAHSRYPVIGEDLDDVIGFVHIRDLADLDPAARNAPVSQLVRPVASLPQSVKILRALSEMRQTRQHLVIVRDEYGGTAGIVTIEDLVEELIGDITDEFDIEQSRATDNHDTTIDLDGLVTLGDFGQQVGYVLPEGPYDTVAGFVMAQLGTLPKVGDACTVVLASEREQEPPHTFELRVTELDGRRAARLRITNLGPVGPTEYVH
jgi:putative hemolysin